jgi:hypothetical protein
MKGDAVNPDPGSLKETIREMTAQGNDAVQDDQGRVLRKLTARLFPGVVDTDEFQRAQTAVLGAIQQLIADNVVQIDWITDKSADSHLNLERHIKALTLVSAEPEQRPIWELYQHLRRGLRQLADLVLLTLHRQPNHEIQLESGLARDRLIELAGLSRDDANLPTYIADTTA